MSQQYFVIVLEPEFAEQRGRLLQELIRSGVPVDAPETKFLLCSKCDVSGRMVELEVEPHSHGEKHMLFVHHKDISLVLQIHDPKKPLGFLSSNEPRE